MLNQFTHRWAKDFDNSFTRCFALVDKLSVGFMMLRNAFGLPDHRLYHDSENRFILAEELPGKDTINYRNLETSMKGGMVHIIINVVGSTGEKQSVDFMVRLLNDGNYEFMFAGSCESTANCFAVWLYDNYMTCLIYRMLTSEGMNDQEFQNACASMNLQRVNGYCFCKEAKTDNGPYVRDMYIGIRRYRSDTKNTLICIPNVHIMISHGITNALRDCSFIDDFGHVHEIYSIDGYRRFESGYK